MNKEYLKEFTKEDIYDVYRVLNVRIKNYDKITRNKMLEVIESEYEDYHNIISIFHEIRGIHYCLFLFFLV